MTLLGAATLAVRQWPRLSKRPAGGGAVPRKCVNGMDSGAGTLPCGDCRVGVTAGRGCPHGSGETVGRQKGGLCRLYALGP